MWHRWGYVLDVEIDWRSWTFGPAVDNDGWLWFHLGPLVAYVSPASDWDDEQFPQDSRYV